MNTKQRRSKLKNGSIAANCLLEILYTTNLLLANVHSPSRAFRYGLEDALEVKEFMDQASQQRALRRLEQRRLIKLKRTADRYEAALTEDGIAEALRLQVACCEELAEGVSCIVVFDIPIEHHRLRRQIRDFLKWAGFTKTQQSVWTSTKDACSALAILFRINSIDTWVRVYRGVEITSH
ncbi:MAG: hypothetical protein UY76_C0011G0005 [Candidatus Uhrbacteria bacterium GW2011_GWA2_52_8d]|uniref:Transcriptional repressor PaaX-like central Cas2-like domain-containing protein n=1 Tax=Candidatus Uhrbacteria bacterium GW2011_GWA2_52_8d TaxID=1618979 RepID=A0A0G2AK60_9BACT|nr:MAG: hypothetical protein UY76_C0011G0005 [Candidatus Uhrbacteria bacterium GW2011_GWA2_52_8d]